MSSLPILQNFVRHRLLALVYLSAVTCVVLLGCYFAIGKALLNVDYYSRHRNEIKNDSYRASKNTATITTSGNNQHYSPEMQKLSFPAALVRTDSLNEDHSEKDESKNYCTHQECFTSEVMRYNLSRAYPSRSDGSWMVTMKADTNKSTTWFRDNLNSKDNESSLDSYKYYGLLYAKVPKTGSSTVAGVMLRIADRAASRKVEQYSKHPTSSPPNTTNDNATGSRKVSKRNIIIPARVHHALPAKELYHSQRHPTKSFMVGSVRDPASRAVSFCFYDASLKKRSEVTERSIMRMLRRHDELGRWISNGRGGTQLYYLSLDDVGKSAYNDDHDTDGDRRNKRSSSSHVIPRQSVWNRDEPEKVKNVALLRTAVQHVIYNYDFIVIQERMQESLVALALVMGVPIEDVLVVASSKRTHHEHETLSNSSIGNMSKFSGFTLGVNRDECVRVIAPFRTPEMDRYLRSDEWYAMNYGDYLLHAAANAALNRTIEHVIGRSRFDRVLADYHQWNKRIAEYCSDDGAAKRDDNYGRNRNESESRIHYPCSKSGQLQLERSKQDCYQEDFGCGYPCLDKLVTSLDSHPY